MAVWTNRCKFGPIEAQGRGSLHPHTLIWLLLTKLSDLLFWMLRDRNSFKQRPNLWMQELVASVASVQESTITHLPQTMQPGDPALHPTLITPFSFGPNERHRYDADGATETATATQLNHVDTGTTGRKT